MADQMDQAQEIEQLRTEQAIASARQAAAKKLPTGMCNYCDVPCKYDFCDKDCRDEYNYEQTIKARQRGECR